MTDHFASHMLLLIGNILPTEHDQTAVREKSSGNRIEQGGFSRAIAADDRCKISGAKRQIDAV